MASVSPPPIHIARLTPADLDVENPALIDLIRFARHVIDQTDPLRAAKYAGVLYLALVSAFEAEAMIDHEWAPALTLEIPSIEYEIRLSSHQEGQSSGVLLGTTQPSSPSKVNEDGKPKVHGRAIDGLLRRIITTPVASVTHLMDESEDRAMLAQDLLRVRDWAHLSAEPCGALVTLLDKVDSLERRGLELSRATNWTYWSLGCAYRAFCELHKGDKAWYHRTQQSRLFTRLCEAEGLRDKVESKLGRSVIQKRLLRARKCVHLVDTLGQAVLNAAPVISISNLDQVSLEQIRLLPCSLADEDLIEAARQRCAQ